jgi:hypothetical protein
MRDHLLSRQPIEGYPLKSLELVSPRAKPHINYDGSYHYFDSVVDFAAFIWNVLDLFYDIETVIIDLPEVRRLDTFIQALKYRVELTMISNKRNSFSTNDTEEWRYWGCCEDTDCGLVLFGKGLKQEKVVQIICQHGSNKW